MGFDLINNFNRPYLQVVSQNSGKDGTYHLLSGSQHMYTYHWAAIDAQKYDVI